jgi:class 3 adenylate cyclase
MRAVSSRSTICILEVHSIGIVAGNVLNTGPFAKFEPTQEAAYLEASRKDQRPRAKGVCLLGIGVVAAYLLINPIILPRGAVLAFLAPAVALLALLGLYLVALGSRLYERYAYFDVPFFAALYVAQLAANASVFEQSSRWGAAPSIVVAYNAAVFVSFISIAIVASFRAFAAVVAGIAIAVGGMIWRFGLPAGGQMLTLFPFLTGLTLALFANAAIDRRGRTVFLLTQELVNQKKLDEDLLHNVLPHDVAERLKSGETVADAFSEVSVIFVDLMGFSRLSRTLSPTHLVEVLNRYFSLADEIAERNRVEKIKTVGDGYLAIVGALTPVANPATVAIAFGLEVIESIAALSDDLQIDLKVRVGIHTGAVVGGVIGTARQAYDYWGDTMNVASRLQEVAPLNGVAVSEATFYRARKDYEFADQRMRSLKGVGETAVHDVLRRRRAAKT